MIRRAGQREKPASAPFSQDGWRAEVVERQFHVIMILEVERHADSQPQIFPTSDERAFTPSSDSGWKMLDTCSTSASPIQQPDSCVTTSCHAQVRRSHRHGYPLQVAELCRGVRESQV